MAGKSPGHRGGLAGGLDLAAAHVENLGDGAVADFLGAPPGPEYHEADPVRQVPLAVPVLCVHGTEDAVVPPSQSHDYVRAATASGAHAELVEVPGDHYVVIDPVSDAWQRTRDLLATF